MQTNPKAVFYIRVSTAKQARFGHSMDNQRDQQAQWRKINGYGEIHTYVDGGKSAKSITKRPKFQKAMDRACAEGVPLVACSLSRMARSNVELLQIVERLHKNNADLVIISQNIDTTTTTGRLLYGILAAVVQFEREIDVERTKEIMDWLKRNGRRYSCHAPYGHRIVRGRMQEDPEEQKAIRLINHLFYDQTLGYSAVARELTRLGVPSRTAVKGSNGKPKWYPATIKRILTRLKKAAYISRGTISQGTMISAKSTVSEAMSETP